MTKLCGLWAILFLCLWSAPCLSLVSSAFRPIDGVGHPTNSTWGAAKQPFYRLFRPRYSDGYGSPSGADFPNPRNISNALFGASKPPLSGFGLSQVKTAWGQFVTHDIAESHDSREKMTSGIPCCDAVFDPLCECNKVMEVARTDYINGTSYREQLNYQTAYLDGSVVYGPSEARLAQLRTFRDGRLRTDGELGCPMNEVGYLMAGSVPLKKQRLTGDLRGNENPGLLALQCLFVLEHNRQAGVLLANNPTWGDERLFQEARKRVSAIIQVINYEEYLPALLGSALPVYAGFNSSVNPSVESAFVVVAYRYGHSAINSLYLRLGPSSNSPNADGTILLRDAFFNPWYLTNETPLESILRGMMSQAEGEVDVLMVDDVRHFVEGLKSDLASRDMLRARDWGLGSYNDVRAGLGLAPATSFADITSDFRLQQMLSTAYGGNVSRVDPWVGGLAEDKMPGISIGPLMYTSIREQFVRLRDGDPWWYQRVFSGAELEEIQRTSLSDVVARNTKYSPPTKRMMVLPSESSASSTGVSLVTSLENGPWLQLNAKYWLKWKLSDDQTSITITMRATTTGWVGFGLGSSMRGADIAVGWVSGGIGQAFDYYSTTNAQPQRDTALGGTNDVTLVAASETSDTTVITFTRRLSASESTDKQISLNVPVAIVYAWGNSDAFEYHTPTQKGTVTIIFTSSGPSEGSITSATASESVVTSSSSSSTTPTIALLSTEGLAWLRSQVRPYFISHAVLMSLSWGLLAPLGIIVMRYMKFWRPWLSVHEALMTGAFLLSITGAGLSFGNKLYTQVEGAHSYIGIIATAAVVTQFLLGRAVAHYRSANNDKSLSPSVVNAIAFAHKMMGRCLFLLTLANGVLGHNKYGEEFGGSGMKFFWLIVVGFWLAVIAVLETIKIVKDRQSNITSRSEVHRVAKGEAGAEADEGANDLRSMTKEEFLRQVKEGAQWSVLDGKIIDVSSYLDGHPGGAATLIEFVGRDMSNVFHGRAAPSSGELHPHGRFAMEMAKGFAVGVLSGSLLVEGAGAGTEDRPAQRVEADQAVDAQSEHSHATAANSTTDATQQRHSRARLDSDNVWALKNRWSVTADVPRPVDRFRFKKLPSESKDPLHAARSIARFGDNEHGVHGRTWGDYYSISTVTDEHMSRPYTVVHVENECTEQGEIELWVKRYEHGAVSRELHRLQVDHQVIIDGPFPGKILEFMLQGKLVMIGGGTGVLPFLDVIDHCTGLQWAARRKALREGLPPPEPVSRKLPDCHITFLSSFRTPDDIIAREFLEEAAQRCPDRFKLVIHTQRAAPSGQQWSGPTGYFSKDMLAEMVPADAARVWVCGPPAMQSSIMKGLRALSRKFLLM